MNETGTPFYANAHGKLLLTGEYFVLDGAQALALPVHYGQSLEVKAGAEPGQLSWLSEDEKARLWFQASFRLPTLDLLEASDTKTAERLQEMFMACRQQNPGFLREQNGLLVRTQMDFPRNWGLGTSSTLIAALAQWADVDPYFVLFETLGGSGYDIACAFAEGPVLYQLQGRRPIVKPVSFKPSFVDQLYFVFLEQKQDSRAGIRRYREYAKQDKKLIDEVSGLTMECFSVQTADQFADLMLQHERLISQALNLPRIQDQLFPDFSGVVKSLGAWGGDFVLAVSVGNQTETQAYFQRKGYSTCIPYREMVL